MSGWQHSSESWPRIHVGDLLWVWWEQDGWFVGRVRFWGHWQPDPPPPNHVWCRMADGEDTPVDLLRDVWSLQPPVPQNKCDDRWDLDVSSAHNLEPPPHWQLLCRQVANSRRMALRSAVKVKRVCYRRTNDILVSCRPIKLSMYVDSLPILNLETDLPEGGGLCVGPWDQCVCRVCGPTC